MRFASSAVSRTRFASFEPVQRISRLLPGSAHRERWRSCDGASPAVSRTRFASFELQRYRRTVTSAAHLAANAAGRRHDLRGLLRGEAVVLLPRAVVDLLREVSEIATHVVRRLEPLLDLV